jgi:hypothetical protein
MTSRRVNLAIAICATGLWLASLVTPALKTCSEGHVSWVDGYGILFFGWLGPLMLLLHPAAVGMIAWYANILLLPNLAKMVSGRTADLWFATPALLLALTSLSPLYFWNEVVGDYPICSRGIGYWLWIAAFAATFAAALRDGFQLRRSRASPC